MLVELARVVPYLFLLLLVACAAVAWALHRGGATGRRIAGALAALAVLAVVPLTLTPDTASPATFCTVQLAWPTLGGVEGLANIAMLVPVACFGTVATRRPIAVLAATTGLSATIELVQALLPALGRACDTSDWEMNTIGAAVGVLLAVLVGAVAARRAGRRAVAA